VKVLEKEQEQQSKENKVGAILKEAREAKGLTLAQVSDATRISKAYLQAVEENNYQKIPGEVFVKGVLRGYGNFLGLDGAKIVEQYKIFAQGLPPEEAVSSKIREVTNVKITPTFKPNEDVPASKKNSLLLGLLVLLLLLLAACAYYFTMVARHAPATGNTGTPSVSTSMPAPAQPQAVTTPAAPAAPVAPFPQTPTENKAAVPAAPVNQVPAAPGTVSVAVECKGICWLQVYDGKKKIFEGTLGKGEKTAFTSQGSLRIVYGNIKDVAITVNGKAEAPLKTNEVVTRTYGQTR
jgi:cytoskeleton protein RodZ